ncbi:hypothetical protein EVA_19297 [gut metagenome]|uniref:Uncharacterized protein n=1 Tax=gut metagenome TaxID=749906 RepID=J9FCJ3_9ZZZZ
MEKRHMNLKTALRLCLSSESMGLERRQRSENWQENFERKGKKSCWRRRIRSVRRQENS